MKHFSTLTSSKLWLVPLLGLLLATQALAQTSYTSQIRGVVSDQSGAVLPKATVTISNDATGISSNAVTDDRGLYLLTGLRPAAYTVKVEATGFQSAARKNVVLAVDQQATLNFTLQPASVSTSVTVTEALPLLDTESATLGTDVTNEYVRDIPLPNRSYFGLVFLAGGVTETTGSGTSDSYPSGTNFVSNGQRNSTAEIRLDGALTSAPEQGEGATTGVYYQPSVEIVQEFKVQNNSFSSEFGNNGGTVVNIVLKQGGNKLHGSGWWFGQRSALDAKDFFNTGAKPDHVRDQYGFAFSGPIKKNRTFFFVDFENTRQNDPINITASVPTLKMRTGDFSEFGGNIYDPFNCTPPGKGCTRAQFTGNQIDSTHWDAIGLALLNLYPKPSPDLPGITNNFRTVLLSSGPSRQFDIKLDHQISPKTRISGRYSNLHSTVSAPTLFADDIFGNSVASDGLASGLTNAHNVSLEFNWTLKPTLLWTSHFGADRASQSSKTHLPDPTSIGFPSILTRDNHISRMPSIITDNFDAYTPLFSQCCVDTNFAHTLYSYSSAMQWAKGAHSLKFGGEQRLFYNNFYQPNYPSGIFNFSIVGTSSDPSGGDGGNTFASILLGWGDSGQLNILPATANKSKETAFYVQDDWKVTSRLTLNLGMRYEWSTPYQERHNRIQFSNFAGDSGVTVPDVTDLEGNVISLGQIHGTTNFASSSNRNVKVDRNNWAPRLGFAYQLGSNTVVRGGAGLYYGLSVATNFQYVGTAFRKSADVHFTTGDNNTRTASLANPFPNGVAPAPGQAYGPLALWGFSNQNDLGTQTARNGEIYQWNLGVQHLFPNKIVLGVDYSASRSTHLPWGGYSSTRNRNFLSSAARAQIVRDHGTDLGGPSGFLDEQVANPFQSLFVGPGAIFNEPDSQYNNDKISRLNLLRPYPQFNGPFEGLPLLAATSNYHSMQIRFQKRPSHYISFEGNYTLSKSTDDSSTGANAFVGNLNTGNPQVLDNLKAEHGISANDATHRIVAAVILDVPLGRGRWVGHDMNRFVDAVAGGWAISTFFTKQTGQPIPVAMQTNRIADGNQRPNVTCSPGTGVSAHDSVLTDTPTINAACFSDPGDQQAGNAPRYFSNLRADGIHNVDLSIYKEFVPKEGMKLQVRAEFFNFTNSPRFSFPDTFFAQPTPTDPGNTNFGKIGSSAPGSTPRHMQIGVRFEF